MDDVQESGVVDNAGAERAGLGGSIDPFLRAVSARWALCRISVRVAANSEGEGSPRVSDWTDDVRDVLRLREGTSTSASFSEEEDGDAETGCMGIEVSKWLETVEGQTTPC